MEGHRYSKFSSTDEPETPRASFPVLIRAHTQLLSWTLDQWIKIFSQCGGLQSFEIFGLDNPHQFQCVARFSSPKAQHKACQLKHEDFSVGLIPAVRSERKFSSAKLIDEPEAKTPSPSPNSRPPPPSRVRVPYHVSPEPGQPTPPLPIARETPRSQLKTPTMLAATPATPVSPGCEPQLDVVEPHENRVITTPRHRPRTRPNRQNRGNGVMRNNGHPLRIYRQQRVLPRTNSGRRVGPPHPDASMQRRQRDCRDSRTMRGDGGGPLILAVEDTPTTPEGQFTGAERREVQRSGSRDESHLAELVRTTSAQSGDSSLHTSASSVTSPRNVNEDMRLYIRGQNVSSNRSCGTIILEREMMLHTLKAKVASVYGLNQSEFELWHPRSQRHLHTNGMNGRISLEDADLAMDDEIVIVCVDEFEDAVAPPATTRPPRGRSRLATLEQRAKMNRGQRASTSPNVVVPRSRAPPTFQIQPHESPMDSFSPPRVLPGPSAVAAIQERRAQRRQRLHARIPQERSTAPVPPPNGGRVDATRPHETITNRNRPISIRSRENIPAIALPNQSRSLSSLNLPRNSDYEGRRDGMIPPPQHGRSARHRKSNTRVRMTNQSMVIRRARRASDAENPAEEGSLSLAELDWSNNNLVRAVEEARQTTDSRQQLVRDHGSRTDFAAAMNFIPGEQPARNVGESQVNEPRQRQRRVKLNRPMSIRIDSSSQLVRAGSRHSPRDHLSEARPAAPAESPSNQALFFFSDEQEELPPVPQQPYHPQEGPPMRSANLSRSAIGAYDPTLRPPRNRGYPPASPLETHSATPRDDALLAQQLAIQMDEEQQEQSSRLAWRMQYLEEDEEKYLRPESPMMLIEPRRGFIVNELDHSPDHLSVIFERFGSFSPLPENDRFEAATYEELLSLDDGIPKSGLTEREIFRLPVRTLETGDQAKRAGKCSVCQEEYQVHDELRRLPCMHEYHRECIDKWLERSKKCPVDMNVVNVE